MEHEERRLAAIFVADVVGYSALMESDEPGTLARVLALREQLMEPLITGGGGRVIKTTGDGLLAEFGSVVHAVGAAIAVQRGLEEWPDIGAPLTLRIGIHSGDVIVSGGDIYGDGVNIAARGTRRHAVDHRDPHPVRGRRGLGCLPRRAAERGRPGRDVTAGSA